MNSSLEKIILATQSRCKLFGLTTAQRMRQSSALISNEYGDSVQAIRATHNISDRRRRYCNFVTDVPILDEDDYPSEGKVRNGDRGGRPSKMLECRLCGYFSVITIEE